MGYIGQSVRRREDLRLLTGRGCYVDDVRLPGALEAAVLRSPHAHARIRRLDASAALAQPGVVAVLTAVDLPDVRIPVRIAALPELERALQPPLARGVVRYVGEPVAVVVAATRYQAEDALERVQVDYEPLPALVDARQAMAPGAPALHASVADNVVARFSTRVGDFAAALAQAEVVIEECFHTNRHAAVPLETRGLVAVYDGTTLTVWGPTKVTHINRSILARLLGLSEERIRFVEPDVGGGFGGRGEFYPEDFCIPFLALRLGRPVRWQEDRAEHLKASNHSREQWHEVTLAARRDGTLLGLRDRLVNDQGAYIRTHGVVVATLTAALLPGPYRIPSYECETACVLTNKGPTGTYRAPGRFEANFVRERMLDLLAGRLGLDPAEVRRRNLIRPDEMPYDMHTTTLGVDVVYDSGDYPRLLERTLAAAGYPALRAQQAAARAAGRAVGIGLGFFVEKTGLGPWEYARVEIESDGHVVVYSGLASVGQGMETALAQIAAEALGVPLDDVRVVHGDTAQVPYGIGSFGSRGLVVGGSAVRNAALELRQKVLRLAAYELEADPADLAIEAGRVQVRGLPERALGLAEVARLARPERALRLGLAPGLRAESFFAVDRMAYPYGLHLAVVEVDRETGGVTLLRYVLGYDVGRAINPMLVEGQLVGGLAQGIGGALYEELAYDEHGQLLAGSFMDYLLPTAAEVPPVEVVLSEEAPSPLNPLGAKGVGEGGTAGAPAAIANAVADALGAPVRDLPLTPERLRRWLRAASPEPLR